MTKLPAPNHAALSWDVLSFMHCIAVDRNLVMAAFESKTKHLRACGVNAAAVKTSQHDGPSEGAVKGSGEKWREGTVKGMGEERRAGGSEGTGEGVQ